MFERRKKAELKFDSEPSQSLEVMKENYLSFSSQFQEIGSENLSLPIINDSVTGSRSCVHFGSKNDFPQLVNQMYYTSPINGAIINFKTNATVGGGYKVTPRTDTPSDKAKIFLFEHMHKVAKNMEPLCKDLYMHASCYILLKFNKEGKLISSSRIPRENVRNTKDKKLYFICEDWTTHRGGVKPIRKFMGSGIDEEMILPFELDSVGQSTYSIASYTSALNWCFLDGQMSYLHKSNIQNSVFPSFMMLFPRKPKSDREKQAIGDSIKSAKGANNAGKVIALFANKADEIPTIAPIPTNQNDKLFEQTDERIDAQVCKAHCIDPILMGIRVAGKLGSGTDIKQAYIIFEKNTIMPMRGWVEQIYNTLMQISGVRGKFEVNNYQIVNETITEIDTNNDALEKLNKLSPLVANKVLESMSKIQILNLIGLKPDMEAKEKEVTTQKTEI